MANANQPAVSFDEIIQEGRRKKQAERLAQEIFGKNRRSSAPPSGPKANLGGSLASRVGVNKRNSSLPRSDTPRQIRSAGQSNRPSMNDSIRSRPSYTKPISGPASEAKSNGYAKDEIANEGNGMNIKGAASGPYTVRAQNFAPGTTAADIESVMLSVGGEMTTCKLLTAHPTVIAELSFVERAGAEKVIETFNGKKADGRPLYVYWSTPTPNDNSTSRPGTQNRPQQAQPEPPPPPPAEDVAMEVDENAEAREAENRLREERRGRDDRTPRDAFPTGPRAYRQPERDAYYDRRPRREPSYQDGRYGFGGGFGGRERYPRDDRRYGHGQRWP